MKNSAPDATGDIHLIPESQKPAPAVPDVHVPEKVPRTLLVRTCSGAVYVAINLAAMLLGTLPTAVIMSITGMITCWEFYRLMRADAKLPNQVVGILFAGLMPLVALTNPVYQIAMIFLLLLFLGLWYVINQRVRIIDIAITVFGVLYTGLMLCAIVMIRSTAPDGIGATALTIGVMASVWINDACAYLVGSAIGRHKLVPKISPKKSWEGFFGGILGSLLTWIVLALIPQTGVTMPVAIVAGIVCGVTGVIGDLVESRIKRGAGVKDSGNLIPGHGGLLDRSDSLLFVGVSAYFILRMMGVL